MSTKRNEPQCEDLSVKREQAKDAVIVSQNTSNFDEKGRGKRTEKRKKGRGHIASEN